MAPRNPSWVEHEQGPPLYEELSRHDVSSVFTNLRISQETNASAKSRLSVDECIAHLKLLEAFHQLREDISTTDGLYGLNDALISDSTEEKEKMGLLARLREKRWAVYVTIAVTRFEAWFKTVQPESQMLTEDILHSPSYERIATEGIPLDFSLDNLPPLGEIDWYEHLLCR